MNEEFYQAHLNRVSRSFAICIQQLEDPLREWVSLMYLFCRVVDTVEDAPWVDVESQLKSFNQLENLLQQYDANLAAEWLRGLPDGIPAEEKALANDFNALTAKLQGIAPESREILISVQSPGAS